MNKKASARKKKPSTRTRSEAASVQFVRERLRRSGPKKLSYSQTRHDWRSYIVVDPNICHGQPCFKGTRVMVSTVLDNLAADLDADQILREYPSLSLDFIRAALAYASDLAKDKLIELSG